MSKQQLMNTTGTLLCPQLDYLLVDGSGSMKSKWWDFMASLDAFVDVLKAANLNSQVIATVFDSHDLEFTQRDELLKDWSPLHERPLNAYWGGTPLYDAINAMARRLRDLDPPNASIVIVTDGDATGSQYTSQPQARALIDWMKAKGWQVTFIGCDFDNSGDAARLGITSSQSIGVAKAQLSNAAKSLGEKRVRHAHTGESMHFTDGEKQQFGGYLNAPSADPKE